MASDGAKPFKTLNEEIEYWKLEAIRYKELANEVQQELQDFRECSEEFEKELESQVEHSEKQIKELKQQNSSLTFEHESLRQRYDKHQEERYRQVSELQDEVARLTSNNSDLTKDVRELEQRNDDLERANRMLIVSLDDFEHRLNQSLERNAILESELDEKDAMSITVQRLRDEARDLHNELAVRNMKGTEQHNSNYEMNEDCANNVNNSLPSTPTPTPKKMQMTNGMFPTSSSPDPATQPNCKLLQNGVDKTPLTPSARISALNIVGDLLRKVGALESKLASCRSFVHSSEQQTNPHAAANRANFLPRHRQTSNSISAFKPSDSPSREQRGDSNLRQPQQSSNTT